MIKYRNTLEVDHLILYIRLTRGAADMIIYRGTDKMTTRIGNIAGSGHLARKSNRMELASCTGMPGGKGSCQLKLCNICEWRS